MLLGSVTVLLLCGCGTANRRPSRARAAPILARLLAGARPIGREPRFHPPARGPIIGPCRRRLGERFGVHVEVFAQDRVVIVPAGIGTRPPRRSFSGRITAASCYGGLVTLEPTGLLLVRPGRRLELGALFRAWGQPLESRRLLFSTGAVRAFLGGRRWRRSPRSIPLTSHAEIVLESGPYVPPHSSYTFPPGS